MTARQHLRTQGCVAVMRHCCSYLVTLGTRLRHARRFLLSPAPALLLFEAPPPNTDVVQKVRCRILAIAVEDILSFGEHMDDARRHGSRTAGDNMRCLSMTGRSALQASDVRY